MRINSIQSNKQLKNDSNEKKTKNNSTMIAVLKLTAYGAVR